MVMQTYKRQSKNDWVEVQNSLEAILLFSATINPPYLGDYW
jgi:hypothetical protein